MKELNMLRLGELDILQCRILKEIKLHVLFQGLFNISVNGNRWLENNKHSI